MALIEAAGVTKSYTRLLPVLDNISFQIEAGDFFYLTGVSGAGKTSVFKLLMMMERPDAGVIRFDGKPLDNFHPAYRAQHRRKIGMVFQDYRLLERETIEENVALPLKVAGVQHAQLKARTEDGLEQVGLRERRRELVVSLSGGEKQLVSIARALVFKPKAFFADEPTGNLDQGMAHQVMELIRGIHEDGCTVIVATHDIHLIRAHRARTLLIKDRKILEVRLTSGSGAGGASSGHSTTAPPAD